MSMSPVDLVGRSLRPLPLPAPPFELRCGTPDLGPSPCGGPGSLRSGNRIEYSKSFYTKQLASEVASDSRHCLGGRLWVMVETRRSSTHRAHDGLER